MREYKSLPQFIKSIEGRTVTGIFAVHGNVDSGLDRSHPGAFSKTFAEQRSRAKFLWNHDFFAPPIAVIKNLREVGADELPDEVRTLAPDATGGAEVTREYLDTPRANEVLEGIKSGAITEMSYGYDAIKMDFTTEGQGEASVRVRELREVRLYDVSDVLWGMNPATVGSKGLPLELIAQTLQALHEDLKAGRRNASADLKLINAIHSAAVALGCDECQGVAAADESGKSRAEAIVASLTPLRRQLQELEVSLLN